MNEYEIINWVYENKLPITAIITLTIASPFYYMSYQENKKQNNKNLSTLTKPKEETLEKELS